MPSFAQAKLHKNDGNIISSQAKPDKSQGNIVLLFHGLGNNAASLDTMKQALHQAFPTADVIALASVEAGKSINLSIQEQAQANFKELSTRVEHLGDRPILLIGHSQGGMRAYQFFKDNKDCLNIKGLVTLGTPWEGVPGARVDAEMLSNHLTDPVLDDLRRLSLELGCAETHLEKQLMLDVQTNQAVCLYPGGKDLMEDSAFLGEVKASLPHETLSILAIGGGQSDFRSLLPKQGAYPFKALNKRYTYFVVGENYPGLTSRHDMKIPLYSQHALNIVPKSKKNFRRIFIQDAFHSTHFLGIAVPKGKAMTAHPLVLAKIIKFIKNRLK